MCDANSLLLIIGNDVDQSCINFGRSRWAKQRKRKSLTPNGAPVPASREPFAARCRRICRSARLLIREIMAGRLADGARLPSEREMAAGLNVAVGTLRRGLQDLQDKGLLERIQGSGNYVRARRGIAWRLRLLPA